MSLNETIRMDSPGEQQPDHGMRKMAPVLEHPAVPRPLSRVTVRGLDVLVVVALALGGMIQRRRIRDIALLERGVFGVDDVVVAVVLGKGRVVKVGMLVLVLGLERWVNLGLGHDLGLVFLFVVIGHIVGVGQTDCSLRSRME